MIGRAREPSTLCDDNNGFGGINGLAVSGNDNRLDGTDDVIVLRILAENDLVMETRVAEEAEVWPPFMLELLLLTAEPALVKGVRPEVSGGSYLHRKKKIQSVSWEYSCDEKYLEEFDIGNILKYSLLQAVLTRNMPDPRKVL